MIGNQDNIIDDILNVYKEVTGRELFISKASRNRLESFIDKALRSEGLSDEEILEYYRYIITYYYKKGYKITPGHLCGRGGLKFLSHVKQNETSLPTYYHRLYGKPHPQISPPYDHKVAVYYKFAVDLMHLSNIMYVPRTGYVLEKAVVIVSQAHAETKLWKNILDTVNKAYDFYLEVRKDRAYRDFSKVWLNKPYWKPFIPIELFNTPFGYLTFSELHLVVSMKEELSHLLSSKERPIFDALEVRVNMVEDRYGEYLWMLPKPRQDIVRMLSNLARG